MNVLGLWDGHDSGAALLCDGRVVAAINEERLSRRKLEVAFPHRSIRACLDLARLDPAAVHVVAVSTSDIAKTLTRLVPQLKERYYLVRRRKAERGLISAATVGAKQVLTTWPPVALSRWMSRLAVAAQLRAHGLDAARLDLHDHHAAHAYAAAYCSGFQECAVLTLDGLGDGCSATTWRFVGGKLARLAASHARHSLGVFFEHVTALLNMRELEDEGKVMALADHASPVGDGTNPLLPFVSVRGDTLETSVPGRRMRRALARVQWHYPNEQFAYMAQRVVESVVVDLARSAVRLTGCSNVALAGGVASNIKASRRVRLLPEVSDVFVFPHMGDGGLALGAALVSAVGARDLDRLPLGDLGLGPAFEPDVIEAALRAAGLPFRRPADLAGEVVHLLAEDGVVLWFQGRMEYGPRALGQRSVLARPDRPAVRDRLNLILKQRVWYQPFCPSLLESEGRRVCADWKGTPDRNMTMAYLVAPEARRFLCGVISMDGSIRPQFVADDAPGPFAAVLRDAKRAWAIGAVLNTSLNIHGEPMVCSPADAIDVFFRSGADALAIGPYLVERGGGWRP